MCLLNIHKIIACLYIFLNSTEVRTEALKIFCVMIHLLVDTWPDFALFRVVRPYIRIYVFLFLFFWPRMKLQAVLNNIVFKLDRSIENCSTGNTLKKH